MSQDRQTFTGFGTSPEVLQHYVSAGIQLFGPFPGSTYPGTTRPLLGLLAGQVDEQPTFATANEQGVIEQSYCTFFLPILRPLRELVGPVNTATLQLVGLLTNALAITAGRIQVVTGKTLAQDRELTLRVQFFVADQKGPLLASIAPNGAALIGGDLVNCADWLRAHHFAVAVNGRLLVEGVDYLTKEAVAAAIAAK